MTICLCLRCNHIILSDQVIVHLKFHTCFNVWLFSFCIHINHNYYNINILNLYLLSTDYDSKSAFYWIKPVCYFPVYLFWIFVVVMSPLCYIHIANYTSVQTMYYDCTQFGATCCPLYELRSIIVNKLLNGVPGPDFPTPPSVPIKGHSVERASLCWW